MTLSDASQQLAAKTANICVSVELTFDYAAGLVHEKNEGSETTMVIPASCNPVPNASALVGWGVAYDNVSQDVYVDNLLVTLQ